MCTIFYEAMCAAADVEHASALPCLGAEECMHMCRGTLDNDGRWSGILMMSLLCFWVWEHFSYIALYGGPESFFG